MKVFTIGCAGRKAEEFVQELSKAGVRTVVDVRSFAGDDSLEPSAPQADPESDIRLLLSSRGIGYRLLAALGNIFLECDDWRERYALFLGRIGDLLVTKLEGLDEPLCLLGGEPRAADCHRIIIASFLASRGHQIAHLEAGPETLQ